MLRGWDLDRLKKTIFKRSFSTEQIKIIPKLQTNIDDKNVSLFPTAVAEFKMLRLTLPQRKFVIEFMMKHIQVKIVDFNFTKLLMKLFYKTDKW